MTWWRRLMCKFNRHDYRLHVHYEMVMWRCRDCGRIARHD